MELYGKHEYKLQSAFNLKKEKRKSFAGVKYMRAATYDIHEEDRG